MKFEESKHYNALKTHKLEKPFGRFYFCDKFYVAEVHEGIHFEWRMIKEIMDELVDFYEPNVKLGYISNRIHSYSVNPQEAWGKVNNEYNMIVASAVVTYNDMAYMNATLEKKFYKKSLKRCMSLDEAVDWILNIKELN